MKTVIKWKGLTYGGTRLLAGSFPGGSMSKFSAGREDSSYHPVGKTLVRV